MLKDNSLFKRRCAAAAACALGVILLGAGCGKKEQSQPADTTVEGTESTESTQETSQYLLDFCADEELNTWFDSLYENTPVKMTYIILGEAPVAMEFTDPDLILQTAEALKTVKIGGLSQENPEYVSDAGGTAVYFEMADGTEKAFSFELGCFRWKDSGYHDVESYGTLPEVEETLSRIGNPQSVYVYSEDRGFYTQYLECYTTQWQEEDGLGGGLYIWLGDEWEIPYIEICRCTSEAEDAETLLEGELSQYIVREIEESGAVLTGTDGSGKIETYTVNKEEYPSIVYRAELPEESDGGGAEYLNLIMVKKDNLLDEPHFIRFCAVYRDEEKETALNEFNRAVREFCFKYMPYQVKNVQPGNYLQEFINDDRVDEWFEGIDGNFPDHLLYIGSDDTKIVEEPEVIRQILEALRTVKIGDVSNKTVGASGRRIYGFEYTETGAEQSFSFFEDTFEWDGEDYEVLNWGELKNTQLW